MTRFDVSSSGANALMELSRKLRLTYENLVDAGVVLEERIGFLEGRDAELYTKIIEASQHITFLVKKDRDNFLQLSNKLMLLSIKLQEILDISSVSTISGEQNGSSEKIFIESTEEKNILDKFYNGLYGTKTINILDSPSGLHLSMVNSKDIVGLFHNDSINIDEFWTHHGENKARFTELALKIGTVRTMIEGGMNLEQIKQDSTLTACVEQYFSLNRAVRVYQYGDKYIFSGEGRRRVRIAQELGLDIPVFIAKIAHIV